MSALVVSEEAAAAVDRVARFVVRFGLTIPAILALESMRPLSFVGSQQRARHRLRQHDHQGHPD